MPSESTLIRSKNQCSKKLIPLLLLSPTPPLISPPYFRIPPSWAKKNDPSPVVRRVGSLIFFNFLVFFSKLRCYIQKNQKVKKPQVPPPLGGKLVLTNLFVSKPVLKNSQGSWTLRPPPIHIIACCYEVDWG